jgi:hypothetical protein
MQDAAIDQAQDRTRGVRIAEDEEDEIPLQMNGVADGARTHDNRNHNRKNGVVTFRKRLNQKKAGECQFVKNRHNRAQNRTHRF